MRILAIGLGGAGGRIVNQLYHVDRRSSKVACVQALAVDVDGDSIAKLTSLPETSKIYFPPLDLTHPDETGTEQTATIEIAEVTARVQTMATGETDAIVLCIGLGGSIADAAPNIITALRSSMTEPIFALVTLPCLSEGERISAKAADDIEMIAPLLDGVIVFDNETWHKKVKISEKMRPPADQSVASILGLKKKKEPVLSPTEKIYSLLNDAIIRRLSLILRAGEFRADGGLDLAEVVLDSGEVLNTMRGMGFITIGYAVEQLPSHPLDFLARLRPSGYFADEHMKKASRIIDLAKQAIYHEVSAPCDITSAHKALVLIAGPSHELSMKGYMTVRKWIDRSIAGLETRSGDYPVTSTKFVAIIVMLSGLENIPRIGELKEIRAQFRAHTAEAARSLETPDTSPPNVPKETIRDEMITLQSDKQKRTSFGPSVPAASRHDAAASSPGIVRRKTSQSPSVIPDIIEVERPEKPTIYKQSGAPAQSIKKPLQSRSAVKEERSETRIESTGVLDYERRKIENELQKQRKLAIQGIREHERHETGVRGGDGGYSQQEQAGADTRRDKEARETSPIKQVIVRKQTAKKVIIHKKTGHKDGIPQTSDSHEGAPLSPEMTPPYESSSSSKTAADQANNELLDIWIRQVVGQKKSPSTEDSGVLRIEETVTVVHDDALLHTDLKRGKPGKEDPDRITGIKIAELSHEDGPSAKKRSRTHDEEDLSIGE